MKIRGILAVGLTMVFATSGLVFGKVAKNNVEASVSETRYQRTTLLTQIDSYSETINFHTADVDQFTMVPALPNYVSQYNCGVTSAGLMVAYMNKSLPGLIPGHVAGTNPIPSIPSLWSWSSQNAAINNMFDELENVMGNNGSAGVTYWEFVLGIPFYALNKGFHPDNIYINSSGGQGVNGNGTFDAADFKSTIKSGKPIALLLNTFNIVGLSADGQGGTDSYSLTHYADIHTMTAFGYREIKYKDSNGNIFRTDFYVQVHAGFNGYTSVWTKLFSYGNLDTTVYYDIS